VVESPSDNNIPFSVPENLICAIHWIFAIVAFFESCFDPFFAPYAIARPLGVVLEMFVSFVKVSIDCCLAFIDALIVAVMDDCLGHTAED
jgi:hypothetical protein